jgi:HSP20 family protein
MLFEQFDSLFDLTRDRLLSGAYTGQALLPATDLLVNDDTVTVVMDVPGMRSEDIQIELRDDVLTVRGERGQPHLPDPDQGTRSWYRLERGYGSFQRTLQVPHGLDPDAITAALNDGVLTLIIPQPESRKPRRIEIGGTSEPVAIQSAQEPEPVGATAY